MYRFNDLTNQKIGRLTVICQQGRNKDRHILWLCECECGNKIVVSSNALKSGHTQSCGCLQKDNTSKARKKHGASGNHKNVERLYKVWVSMRARCNNPQNKSYQYYGGRGVKVCYEWDDYSNFKSWALENGYDDSANYGDCTIDRIDVNGDYEPSNCRWVDIATQNKNKRARMDEAE